MKNKLKMTLFLLMLSALSFAQGKYADRLIQRNGKVIVCQVREISDDEIKYVMEGYRDDLVFGIDKNKVKTIVFADGREMDLSDSMFGRENYADQRKNAFKFNFFSPLSGASAFSYERSLKPGGSFEIGFGIVGLGTEQDDAKDATGFFGSIGYKFIKDPDFYVKGMRYAHILKGVYLKPELAFTTFSYTDYYNSWMNGNQISHYNKISTTKGAFILNVGKQWIFSDRFLVDWYVGAGYGIKDRGSRNFGFTMPDSDSPLVLNSGFRIGLLF